ncbi:hypothetical protein CRE_03350 [Caenorhabditis remanei]|uniref:Uncharacterized protein n=1 Tax=Caenorhabditis remanei TaxID=31234 RepID=E3MYN0_CAERE|nr:hypothetical protein CRE_03350 [Caenorhabditis remanei]
MPFALFRGIEATWNALKSKLRNRFGTPEHRLGGHMYNYMWRRFYDKEKLLNRLLIEMGSYRRVDSFEDIHFSDSSPSSESSPERSPSPSSSPPDSSPSSAEDEAGFIEDESEAEQEDEPNNDEEDKSDTESEPESQDDSEPDHQQGDIGTSCACPCEPRPSRNRHREHHQEQHVPDLSQIGPTVEDQTTEPPVVAAQHVTRGLRRKLTTEAPIAVPTTKAPLKLKPTRKPKPTNSKKTGH